MWVHQQEVQKEKDNINLLKLQIQLVLYFIYSLYYDEEETFDMNGEIVATNRGSYNYVFQFAWYIFYISTLHDIYFIFFNKRLS